MSDEAMIARCRALATGIWADALDACGLVGVIRGIVLRGGTGRIAGPAATARQGSDDFTVELAAYGVQRMIASARAGEVLVVDAGGAEVSSFGGMASLATRNRGLAGVVIDGACRDLDEIRASGVWVASRHVTPLSGKRRLRLESVGRPIIVSQVEIHPGDMVIGDETGTVVVPKTRLSEVLEEAERMSGLDASIEAALREGRSFDEAVKATGGYV